MNDNPCNNFLILDAIGTRFRVPKEAFEDYPTSLFHTLAHLDKLDNEKLPRHIVKISDDEFFVRRSPETVRVVLLYCFNGKLHVPRCICGDEVAEEFNFWRVKYEILCPNCASHHHYDHSSDDEKTNESQESQCKKSMSTLWTVLQDPNSSRLAYVYNIFSMLVIFISIVNIILSSTPSLQYCPNESNTTKSTEDVEAANEETVFQWTNCVGTFVFDIVDIVCMSWFTMELILRFISCPNYKTFFKSPLIIIDILSILPFYFELIIWLVEENDGQLSNGNVLLTFFKMFNLCRVFRVLKLARYSSSLQVLGKTLYSAKHDLWMLLLFVVLALLIFSNCLYQVEKDQVGTEFISIPASIWWCIVTLCTVGYGDMYPQTVVGKFIAGLACICGVLLFALPIAVLVEKFTTTYNEQRKKDKERHRRKHLFTFHFTSHHHHHHRSNGIRRHHNHHDRVEVDKF